MNKIITGEIDGEVIWRYETTVDKLIKIFYEQGISKRTDRELAKESSDRGGSVLNHPITG